MDQAPIRNPREFQAAIVGKSGPVQLRLYGESGDKPPIRTVGREPSAATPAGGRVRAALFAFSGPGKPLS